MTKTLLVSALTAGGSDGGPRLVARDKATGRIVGSVDLPSGAIGTPMTYLVGGRQYIALTVGGGPRLIALALPGRSLRRRTARELARLDAKTTIGSRQYGPIAGMTASAP